MKKDPYRKKESTYEIIDLVVTIGLIVCALFIIKWLLQ